MVLARSTDGGHNFTNYAWTDDPFEASDVFFGDYSGLAAYGGRVYGIWTEKPAPAPEAKDKPEEGKKRLKEGRNHSLEGPLSKSEPRTLRRRSSASKPCSLLAYNFNRK